MWLISLRDLQWRRRRFVIAVVSAALAFALTLLLEGTMAHLRNESQRMVDLYDVNAWVVADGASGPFATAPRRPAARPRRRADRAPRSAPLGHGSGHRDLDGRRPPGQRVPPPRPRRRRVPRVLLVPLTRPAAVLVSGARNSSGDR
jgi:hypothetical protein